MTYSLLYWILMLFWFFFGIWSGWPAAGSPGTAFRPIGGTLLLFILLVLIGIHDFGFPLHQ